MNQYEYNTTLSKKVLHCEGLLCLSCAQQLQSFNFFEGNHFLINFSMFAFSLLLLQLLPFSPSLPSSFSLSSRFFSWTFQSFPCCFKTVLSTYLETHTHLWQQQELTACSTTWNRFLCSIKFKGKSEHRQFIEKFTFPIKWKVNEDNIRRKHAEDKKQFTGFWLLLCMQPATFKHSN